jgi:cytochrome bd ubiquinol oxidase subunit I
VRETLYSNGIAIDEVAELRKYGLTEHEDIYPLRDADSYPTAQLRNGAIVYRQLCSACHTLAGTNALDELTRTWTMEQKRLNIAQLQRTKPFMPPFAGTASEVESIVQLLDWRRHGQPTSWPEPTDDASQAETLGRIQRYLDEVGTQPADKAQRIAAWRDYVRRSAAARGTP